MKLYHVAALSLVGWYLMVPPWSGPDKFDEKAPLSKWDQDSAYDTAATCEQDRLTNVYTAGACVALMSATDSARATVRFNHDRFLAGRCVSSDDPCLAK